MRAVARGLLGCGAAGGQLRAYSRAARPRSVYSLDQSDEARRQLTMGLGLDPARPVAPPVPILESVFDDANLYTETAWKNLKFPFVTPQTAFVTSPAAVKGCNALATSQLFVQRLLVRCGTKLSVEGLASLYFFPPWHPIAQARKSRPALAVLRGPGVQFNGNANVKQAKSVKSMNPLDYAVWRQRAARRFRRALMESYRVDGLYVVMMFKMPTAAESRSLMTQFTETVARADLRWADKQAGIVNLDKLDAQLARVHSMPTPRHLSRLEWT